MHNGLMLLIATVIQIVQAARLCLAAFSFLLLPFPQPSPTS
jgi:hypothetical protein